jgi:hypothetical protein
LTTTHIILALSSITIYENARKDTVLLNLRQQSASADKQVHHFALNIQMRASSTIAKIAYSFQGKGLEVSEVE